MLTEIQPVSPGIPSGLLDALIQFNQAHRLMMRYFHPSVKLYFPADLTRSQYEEITEALYEIDSSDSAAQIIQQAREAFGIYAYKRDQIAF